MKKSIRSMALLLVLALALSLLPGCGGGTQATEKSTNDPAKTEATVAPAASAAPAAPAAGEVVLRGMHWVSSTAEQAAYNEKFAEFEKQNPGIKIKWEWYPQGYAEKLTALFASNQAPDVFMNYVGDLGDRVTKGFMAPLTSYFKADGFDGNTDLFPNAVIKYNGDIYGILDVITPQVLYYNKDIFDKAGVPYPSDNWTWDDLKNAATKLTIKDGGKITQYGFQTDEYCRVWLSHFWSNGGKVFDSEEKPTKPTFTGPEGVAAAQYLVDMVQTLGVAPPPGVAGGLGFREAFTNGKTAMTLDGSWMNSQYAQKQGLNYDVALVPKGSVKRGGWMAPTAASMSTQTKYKEQAWKYIKFCFSYDSSMRRAGYGDPLKSSGVPVWKSAYKDAKWKPSHQIEMIAKQAEFAQTEMAFQYYGVWFWDTLNAGLQDMLANKKDPQTAMNQIAAKTEKDVLSQIGK